MKIQNLYIRNFRGIRNLQAEGLGDTIIVAGQNGSGKSCIFDAIRLLKSTIGGYQQNEWQNFFGEFQIQLAGRSRNLHGLFNDATLPLNISCDFELRERERAYVKEYARELLEESIWQILLPEAFQFGGYQKARFSVQFRERQPEVDARVLIELPGILSELASSHISGSIELFQDGTVNTRNSNLLKVIFSNYRPRHLGVVDFHGAQRHYARENVQGINLNLEQTNINTSQSALYNYNNKYNNVKSEMAGSYIKELLAEKAAHSLGFSAKESLSDTLKALFVAFFPGKEFLGPQPTADGSLSFPVRTSGGGVHDLDELSSGEKEILYGYLRMRSSAPSDSIIMLDEPELHLNPRLIRGLPEFYRKHLGETLGNQLWLVTHSDALIREALGKPGFSVFHMTPGTKDIGIGNQLNELTTADLDYVLADLVGDLAAYRPGGKALIFEGGGDADFDKHFVSALFSKELDGFNLVSGSNRSRVRSLHEILERAHKKGDLPTKFFAILDRDSAKDPEDSEAVSRFYWNCYHIENYLLDAEIIREVQTSINPLIRSTLADIEQGLLEAARQVIPSVVTHKMTEYVNGRLINAINLKFDPADSDVGRAIFRSSDRSMDRIQALRDSELSQDVLLAEEQRLRKVFETVLMDGSWRIELPGRDILKRYVSDRAIPANYEVFRNLLISQMSRNGIKPAGMKAVIDTICTG